MSTFRETGLHEAIIQAVEELGFKEPTPIQEKTIPFLLESEGDLIALAQTGTGKTAAFGLPMIHHIDSKNKSVQGLVLCPTRELCMQITNDLDEYSKYVEGLIVVPVYGGASMDKQVFSLKRGSQIVVGTPGRVLDLINRKKLILENLRFLVLDEADEMLNMGFKDDLDEILSNTPDSRRSMLFSATMPKEIANLAKKYMQNAQEISVGKPNAGAENVNHHFYVVQASQRYLVLKRIADYYPSIYGIVFCRTRMETKEIADKLIQDGYNADSLHGDLSQAQRDHVMNKFRMRNLQILVATDVAARGLDVNDLSHIINYNIPDELEAYIHRSGRTGRAGKHGISISIIHSKELNKISQLEKKVGKPFEKKTIPTGKDICEKQLFNLIDKVEWVEVDESRIESYLDMIYKKLAWLPREELIKRFVSVEFNRFLAYYKDAADLNVALTKKDKLREPRREPLKQSNPNYTRFHINAGTKDGLSVLNLIALINEHTGNNSMEIGQIEILKKFSFFEVEKENEKVLLDAFQDVDYAGMKLKIEVTKNPSVDSEFPVRERESDESDAESSDSSEGGFKSRGGYKSRDDFKSKGGYKSREGRTGGEKRSGDFAPRERRRSDEGSGSRDDRRGGEGYKSSDSFRSKDGYKPREGYKTRDEKRSDEYKPREGGYKSREGGSSRAGGYKSREGGSSREGYKPREGGFKSREGGFKSREGGSSREGYKPREGGYKSRDDRKGADSSPSRDRYRGGEGSSSRDKTSSGRPDKPWGKKPEKTGGWFGKKDDTRPDRKTGDTPARRPRISGGDDKKAGPKSRGNFGKKFGGNFRDKFKGESNY